MTFPHLMVWSVIIGVLYFGLGNRLRAFGARFRHEAAVLGTDLLNDPNVPKSLKDTIEGILVRVPSGQIAWAFASCAIPATISLLVGKETKGLVSPTARYFEKWDAFTDAAILASLCNSPAAALLCALELAALSFLVSAQMIVDLMAEHVGKRDDGKMLNRDAAANTQ